MKIIARKTDFYLQEEFFKDIITKDYVDGVSLDIILNVDNKILVYNYQSSGEYTVQQSQNTPLKNLISSSMLTLNRVLELIYENRKTLPIYLNLIPNTLAISSEEDLYKLNKRNREYLSVLKNILDIYPRLNINLHSVSRNLVLMMQKEFLKNKIGFVIYTGDLTLADVDYYVFPTYMIDDVIFKELIDNKKQIIIFIEGETDLALVTEKYKSKNISLFSKSILNDLSFIINQPILLESIFNV